MSFWRWEMVSWLLFGGREMMHGRLFGCLDVWRKLGRPERGAERGAERGDGWPPMGGCTRPYLAIRNVETTKRPSSRSATRDSQLRLNTCTLTSLLTVYPPIASALFSALFSTLVMRTLSDHRSRGRGCLRESNSSTAGKRQDRSCGNNTCMDEDTVLVG